MMAIGGMVGSSIFTLSGVTYGMAGSAALVTWFLAGIILLLYALNIAELATTFPKSGGVYVYPHEVLGKTPKAKSFAGWIAAWSWLNVSIFGSFEQQSSADSDSNRMDCTYMVPECQKCQCIR